MVLKENNENKILNASIKVFSRKGYDQATIDEIAKRAHVSKGLVFLYFKRKDDLIVKAAMKSVPFEEFTDLNKREYKSARELLIDFGTSFLKKYENPDMRSLLLMTIASKGRFRQIDYALRTVCFEEMDRVFSRLEELIKQSVPAPIRRAFFGSLLCYVVWWEDNKMNPEDYVRTLTDSFLNMVKEKN